MFNAAAIHARRGDADSALKLIAQFKEATGTELGELCLLYTSRCV